MRVQKIASPPAGQPAVRLVDGDGQQVVEVAEFLRLLVVRDYSPNTIRAYAHDLQKLYQFLQLQSLTVEQFTPARAVSFVEWLCTQSSRRKAQRLDLALTGENGRLLAARTCNRVLAAVSSF